LEFGVEQQAFKGEAGVPNTRVFRVVGWEAGLRAEPAWQQG